LQDCSTDFEFLPIDVSLGRCLRYFQKLSSAHTYGSPTGFMLIGYNSTTAYGVINFLITMRNPPSISYSGNLRLADQVVFGGAITNIVFNYISNITAEIVGTVSSGITANRVYQVQNNNDATASLNLSSEL
jgi:hypothetical protein